MSTEPEAKPYTPEDLRKYVFSYNGEIDDDRLLATAEENESLKAQLERYAAPVSDEECERFFMERFDHNDKIALKRFLERRRNP